MVGGMTWDPEVECLADELQIQSVYPWTEVALIKAEHIFLNVHFKNRRVNNIVIYDSANAVLCCRL